MMSAACRQSPRHRPSTVKRRRHSDNSLWNHVLPLLSTPLESNINMSERKIALVTGALGGIGSEICRSLVAAGYKIIATVVPRET